MLLIAPLFVAAIIATGALAITFISSKKPKYKRHDPEAVDIQFLPENSDWVIKVYAARNFYESHVYYNGNFEEKLTGFGSIEEAMGAGISWARLYSE